MRFKAKRDKVYVTLSFVSWIFITLVILALFWLDPKSPPYNEWPIVLVIILLVQVVLFLFLYDIEYVFREKHLFVRRGPIFSRIPYEKITKVAPTKEWWYGYTFLSSRDALEISYGQSLLGGVKISPKNKEIFLREIEKRCAHAIIQS
jgi:hypothetical protein